MLRVGALLCSMASVATACPALAQETTDAQRALGRSEYRDGVQASRAGRWDEARDAFHRAYDLVRLPEILFNLAGAQEQTGQLVEAAETYRRFLREGTTQQAAELRSDAEEFLRQLGDRIPGLRVSVTGFSTGDRLQIDGADVASAVIGRTLPVNPGHHVVVVHRGRTSLARAEVSVAEGETRATELSVPHLAPEDVALAAQRQDEARLRDSGGDRSGASGGLLSSPWFWTALGAVVVVAVVTVVLLTRPAQPDPYVGNIETVRF